MPRETDLLRVKLVAHTLLDVQIQETALSPVIVSHPFTNSGISALRNEDGSLSMLSHDLKALELQHLKAKAAKIPPKIRVFSFIMLMCFMMTYIVIIVYQIVNSLGSLF